MQSITIIISQSLCTPEFLTVSMSDNNKLYWSNLCNLFINLELEMKFPQCIYQLLLSRLFDVIVVMQ